MVQIDSTFLAPKSLQPISQHLQPTGAIFTRQRVDVFIKCEWERQFGTDGVTKTHVVLYLLLIITIFKSSVFSFRLGEVDLDISHYMTNDMSLPMGAA